MAKEVVSVPNRPKTPYSPGIKAGDYIFVSGQVGLVDDKGRELKRIEAQTLSSARLPTILRKSTVRLQLAIRSNVLRG